MDINTHVFTEDEEREDIEYALDDTDTVYNFIFDGVCVGQFKLRFQPHRSRVEVWSVLIEPRFRGKGFAKLMMRDAIKLCRRLGFRHMWLNVYRSNGPAKAVYKAVGFELKSAGFCMMEGTLDLEKTKAVQRVLH